MPGLSTGQISREQTAPGMVRHSSLGHIVSTDWSFAAGQQGIIGSTMVIGELLLDRMKIDRIKLSVTALLTLMLVWT